MQDMRVSYNRSNLAQFVLMISLHCFVFGGTDVSASCSWHYVSRPPIPAGYRGSPSIFCDPFNKNSVLSLPCHVSGPSAVELNWYFASSSGNVLLTNSSKYKLVGSIDYGANDVTVSLNVTFTNLIVDSDDGVYECIATVKETNNVLAPSISFNMTKSKPPFNGTCNYSNSQPAKNQDDYPVCAEEIVTSTAPHLQETTSSSYLEPSPSTLLLIHPSSSSTWPFQNGSSSWVPVTSTTTNKTGTGSSQMKGGITLAVNTGAATTASMFDSSQVKTPLGPAITNTAGSSNKVSTKSGQETPPVDTWFYLLSVVVVLTFLMIILVLILVIFCIIKRSNSGHLVHSPSTQEEIGIHRATSRLPSDPLPRIRNDITSSDGRDSSTDSCQLSTTMPQRQITFVQSGPINNGVTTQQSLQHLSFNLGLSFQSNDTLYDEIGPPLSHEGPLDIRRNSLDYVNRWQFTLESDSTSATYTLPPDAKDLDVSSLVEAQSQQGNTDTDHHQQDQGCNDVVTGETGDSVGTMSSTTTDCVWFDHNNSSPVTISQHELPWENSNTISSLLFSLSPTESSQASGSPFLSEDLPEGLSQDDDDDDLVSDSVVVCESHAPSSSAQANTLDGQIFELNSRHCVQVEPPLHCKLDSVKFLPSATTKNTGTDTNGREGMQFCQNLLTNNISIQGGSPPGKSTTGRDSNDSRLSFSASGCTDISKYTGDYDRDPAYMRSLMSRVRPLLPGATSPEMLTDDFNVEIRADSGMESMYTDPTSSSALSPESDSVDNLYPRSPSNNVYKSLNCLTMEPESLYDHVCRDQLCDCQVHHKNCT